MNCNICDYKGNISDLHQHIMKKDDCYKKYPPSDLLEIEKQFNSGKTEKRKISNATYYKKRKSQKALQVKNLFVKYFRYKVISNLSV